MRAAYRCQRLRTFRHLLPAFRTSDVLHRTPGQVYLSFGSDSRCYGLSAAGRTSCFLASRGGKTVELLPILSICKRKSVTVIAVTENLESPLAKGADIVLQMLVTKEVDPFNEQSTTSFTVLSVLFDALQAALIEVYRVSERAVRAHPPRRCSWRSVERQKIALCFIR